MRIATIMITITTTRQQGNLGYFGQLTAIGQHGKHHIFLLTCQPPGSVEFNIKQFSTKLWILIISKIQHNSETFSQNQRYY